MNFKRIFLLVLDSVGVGEAIDADNYGDKGANTLGHIIEKTNLFIPNLSKLGIEHTLSMNNSESEAYYTIARPKNIGKDSLSGHYELMGIENKGHYKTFNNQVLPRDLLENIAQKVQMPIIGNVVSDSKKVINQLAKRQEETKSLIIYTTGDSNLIVAANEAVVPVNKLYEYCETIREITTREEWKIASIIAQPFKEVDGKYQETSDDRRYTLMPSNKSVLDILKGSNLQTISIGKVADIFNNHGITKIIKASNNNEAINKLIDIMDKNFEGLCFANLNDFDSMYGHSRDINGYKNALESLDVELPIIINKLNIDDLLIITADHGNDPTMPNYNHTRENVPVLLYSRAFTESGQLEILDTLADIGATIADNFKLEKPWFGTSFLDKLK